MSWIGSTVMSEVLPPKRQAAVDRLRRRVDVYTKDHQERYLHYERIAPALIEQQMHESFALKQKYLDPKAKKTSINSGSGSSSVKSSGSSSTKTNKTATESSQTSNTQPVRILLYITARILKNLRLSSACPSHHRSLTFAPLCVCVRPMRKGRNH